LVDKIHPIHRQARVLRKRSQIVFVRETSTYDNVVKIKTDGPDASSERRLPHAVS